MDIKRKRGLKGLMAVTLAAVTALTIGTMAPATAKAGTTGNTSTEVAISKDYKLPSNLTSGSAFGATFTYQFTSTSVNGVAPDTNNTMPDISAVTITPTTTPAFSTTANGITEYGKNAADFLPVVGTEATNFTHAGEYVYTVSEKNGGTTSTDGVVYSDAQYQIHVYVINDDTVEGTPKLKISDVSVYKTATDDGTAQSGTDVANKVDPVPGSSTTLGGMVFNNTYKKDTNLTISKAVAGAEGDKTHDFTYTGLTLTVPTGVTAPTTVYLKKSDGTYLTGAVSGQKITFADFTLSDGESVTFTDNKTTVKDVLPVGTTYTFTESATSGYTPVGVVSTDVNGTASTQTTTVGAVGTTLPIDATAASANGKNTLGITAANNSVAVTNTYKTVSPTGIIIQNLPFIIMGIVAVGGIALLALSRRRKNNA
ncbi:MAG: hypothetical protein PHR15_05955 [Atopobiaceae bacterium]|jgi:hypothetical protein|nr:hypothetical protein [Atopobiaceae bacterium]MCH4180876.1 hypothetical protein [Atopobiaceae bacterium]MCH4213451.1 hypothetical protein [Atopobiaceae bacterium]MCH4230274.1 hypothetical protein [Atopobiaceae bacterium]MCH4277279.1 hypothetical protein [Atopobiaceae bacterium]